MPLSKPLRLASIAFATLVLALAVAALAQEQQAAQREQQAAEKKAAEKKDPAAPSPDAAFAEFLKLNAPGEHHAHMKQLAGDWDCDVEMRMTPEQPWQKSKGKTHSETLLDGRYLGAEFSGDMMGMPFKGMSLMGYDNMKKKYFTAWIDSMSTGIMLFEGKCDGGKVFTFTGEYEDPMTKRKSKIRQVTTVASPDKHTFEWYETPDGGKEFKSMTITYTKAK
jgi:hypothetical protein